LSLKKQHEQIEISYGLFLGELKFLPELAYQWFWKSINSPGEGFGNTKNYATAPLHQW